MYISDENDNEYELKVYGQIVKNNYVMVPIANYIIKNKKSNYYYVDLDTSDVETIFLSKSIVESSFTIYPISFK